MRAFRNAFRWAFGANGLKRAIRRTERATALRERAYALLARASETTDDVEALVMQAEATALLAWADARDAMAGGDLAAACDAWDEARDWRRRVWVMARAVPA